MQPRFTVAEIAERLEVDKEVARGFIKFLVIVSLAELKGERKPDGGRGRAEAVYSFDDGYEGKLKELLEGAKLT